MSTAVATLRLACQANGLGISGSSATLLKRLLSSCTKRPKKLKLMTKKAAPTTPHKTAKFKGTASGGVRLSASHYFHNMCDAKITRCKPQVILQPDGRRRLKEIRIVTRGQKTYPIWVNA